MRLILYIVLLIVFYGFSNNEGFHIKPNLGKIITSIIVAIIILPLVLIKN